MTPNNKCSHHLAKSEPIVRLLNNNTDKCRHHLSKSEQILVLSTEPSSKPILNSSLKPSKVVDEFKLIKFLGKVIYATTYLVQFKDQSFDDKQYALKLIKMTNKDGQKVKVQREFDVLSYLNHPNITKAFRLFETEFLDYKKYAILLEYRSGQNLEKFLLGKNKLTNQENKLTNQEIIHISGELIKTINYISSLNMIHGDIKPENIIYHQETSTVTLIDFGFAGSVSPNSSHKLMVNTKKLNGSPLYMAPELILQLNKDLENLKGTDIWSLGISIYFMFYKTEPFNSFSLNQFRKLMKKSPKVTFPINNLPPDKIKKIIEITLVHEKEKRATISNLMKLWFEH